MKNNNYNKAYVEVLEILKYVPKESVDKIPIEMIDMFKRERDLGYQYKIDYYKSFNNQDMLIETKAILANIFRDYWATPYQRERIIAKEKYDMQKIEQEKYKKYNLDEIFRNKSSKSIEKTANIPEISNLPVKVEKEKFYQKFIRFIKRILNIDQ